MDCIGNCSSGAITYARPSKVAHAKADVKTDEPKADADTSRRSFLTLASLFAVGAAVKAQESKVDGGLAVIEDKKIPARKCKITPPGSKGIKHITQ